MLVLVIDVECLWRRFPILGGNLHLMKHFLIAFVSKIIGNNLDFLLYIADCEFATNILSDTTLSDAERQQYLTFKHILLQNAQMYFSGHVRESSLLLSNQTHLFIDFQAYDILSVVILTDNLDVVRMFAREFKWSVLIIGSVQVMETLPLLREFGSLPHVLKFCCLGDFFDMDQFISSNLNADDNQMKHFNQEYNAALNAGNLWTNSNTVMNQPIHNKYDINYDSSHLIHDHQVLPQGDKNDSSYFCNQYPHQVNSSVEQTTVSSSVIEKTKQKSNVGKPSFDKKIKKQRHDNFSAPFSPHCTNDNDKNANHNHITLQQQGRTCHPFEQASSLNDAQFNASASSQNFLLPPSPNFDSNKNGGESCNSGFPEDYNVSLLAPSTNFSSSLFKGLNSQSQNHSYNLSKSDNNSNSMQLSHNIRQNNKSYSRFNRLSNAEMCVDGDTCIVYACTSRHPPSRFPLCLVTGCSDIQHIHPPIPPPLEVSPNLSDVSNHTSQLYFKFPVSPAISNLSSNSHCHPCKQGAACIRFTCPQIHPKDRKSLCLTAGCTLTSHIHHPSLLTIQLTAPFQRYSGTTNSSPLITDDLLMTGHEAWNSRSPMMLSPQQQHKFNFNIHHTQNTAADLLPKHNLDRNENSKPNLSANKKIETDFTCTLSRNTYKTSSSKDLNQINLSWHNDKHRYTHSHLHNNNLISLNNENPISNKKINPYNNNNNFSMNYHKNVNNDNSDIIFNTNGFIMSNNTSHQFQIADENLNKCFYSYLMHANFNNLPPSMNQSHCINEDAANISSFITPTTVTTTPATNIPLLPSPNSFKDLESNEHGLPKSNLETYNKSNNKSNNNKNKTARGFPSDPLLASRPCKYSMHCIWYECPFVHPPGRRPLCCEPACTLVSHIHPSSGPTPKVPPIPPFKCSRSCKRASCPERHPPGRLGLCVGVAKECTCPLIHVRNMSTLKCLYGAACNLFSCTCRHPASRRILCPHYSNDGCSCMGISRKGCDVDIPFLQSIAGDCPEGAACSNVTCSQVHPRGRTGICLLWNCECPHLHFSPPLRELCPNGANCQIFFCKFSHPPKSFRRCLELKDDGCPCQGVHREGRRVLPIVVADGNIS